MKVLMSSMSKGGTKTLASALRILGYKVYDFEEQFWYLGKELKRAMEVGCSTDEFREMFKNVDATTDTPASFFWEEILTAFPDVKIIHTERESEEIWCKSFNKQLDEMKQNPLLRILMFLIPTGQRLRQHFNNAGRCQFSNPPFFPFVPHVRNPTLYKIRYREHNTRVKQIAPKDQLLMFNLKDGWKPLCEFLGKPIPDQPFPHKNVGGEVMAEAIASSYIVHQIRFEITLLLTCVTCIIGMFVYYFYW